MGAASSLFGLKEELGLDFVGDSQLDITPFQRQIFEAEKNREAKAQEEQMEQARSGGSSGGRTPNSKNNQSPPGSSDLSRSETVRYINESDEGDEDTLSVID